MKCRYCNSIASRVLDSRLIENGTAIRRRRECINCRKRFTTYERIEYSPILVIKKDNTREPFNSDKIKNGILRACEKRPISMNQIQNACEAIEKKIFDNCVDEEISSLKIGEITMEELKALDEVAYVRFASVYRRFSEADSFVEVIKNLNKN